MEENEIPQLSIEPKPVGDYIEITAEAPDGWFIWVNGWRYTPEQRTFGEPSYAEQMLKGQAFGL